MNADYTPQSGNYAIVYTDLVSGRRSLIAVFNTSHDAFNSTTQPECENIATELADQLNADIEEAEDLIKVKYVAVFDDIEYFLKGEID